MNLAPHGSLKLSGILRLHKVFDATSSVCDVWFQYAPLYFTNQLSDDEYLDKLNAALYEIVQ